MKNTIFSVGDSINMMGDVATIMLCVENEDESNDKTYNVYRYNGELQIDRRIVVNIKHDILLNIDIIIDELKISLKKKTKKAHRFKYALCHQVYSSPKNTVIHCVNKVIGTNCI
ncbi:MAG: hypothetical protein IKU00_02000 [Bacteroidales bacterium]|nr:hypothetical protein [Bacteroidales bacterium]